MKLIIGILAVLFALFMMWVTHKTSEADHGLEAVKIFVLCLIVLAILSACSGVTPYVAARHIDATPTQGGTDGWDVACAGVKKRGQLTIKAGYCGNIRGGDMLEASIEYDLIGSDQ